MAITNALCDMVVYDRTNGGSWAKDTLGISRVDSRMVDVTTKHGTYRVSGRDLIAAVEAMLKLGGVR